jgi:hypothetical protein
LAHRRYEVPPDVDDAPLLDWLGELAGDWRVEELPELLELLELLELPELLELFELLELLERFDDVEEEPDEPDDPVLVEVVPDDVPETLTEACVAPGSTATSAPATATLAKDAVTVVAFSRRLPCSRSATARASCRALT